MTPVYQNIINELNKNRIIFIETEHDSVFTANEANQLNEIDFGKGLKSIALTGKNNIFILTIRDDERINFAKLKKWIGFKMSFLKKELILLTGAEIGGLSPFGYSSNITCFISAKAKDLSSFEINPGVNNKTIKLCNSSFHKMLDLFSVKEIPHNISETE